MKLKQIIDGKTYNTETAEKIGEYWNGLGSNDFGYVYEGIYKTARGNYFLAGQGGCQSKYATNEGNSVYFGKKIEPLYEEEIIPMLERWGETEAIEKHFSHMIEEA
tara:strand:- start:132 stop:449 length:318 start_codon:yes stop_codon:yes gene_type:complete